MAKPSIDLSDANAWDDSALVAAWDAAAEEYKKYHSIHARGEKVEDVLNKHELAQLREEHRQQNRTSGAAEPGVDEDDEFEDEEDDAAYDEADHDTRAPNGEVNDGSYQVVPAVADLPDSDTPSAQEPAHQVLQPSQPTGPSAAFNPATQLPSAAATAALPGLAALPQAVLGQVAAGDDDALKNALMSWYYAGYYTGLYEGRIQGASAAATTTTTAGATTAPRPPPVEGNGTTPTA